MARSELTPGRRRTRLIITLTSLGLILAILTGIGIYGLLTDNSRDPVPILSQEEEMPTTSPISSSEVLPPLPRTADPEVFAAAVAQALFSWDTFTLLTPRDHRDTLLRAADPSGIETAGLVADLSSYLPEQDAWTRLQEYRTKQWLQIDSIYVPEQWHEAEVVGGDAIVPGTVAYTIEGIRHREGLWDDEPVVSQHGVAFTVFVSCQPSYDPCVLLRLSALDQPLK